MQERQAWNQSESKSDHLFLIRETVEAESLPTVYRLNRTEKKESPSQAVLPPPPNEQAYIAKSVYTASQNTHSYDLRKPLIPRTNRITEAHSWTN